MSRDLDILEPVVGHRILILTLRNHYFGRNNIAGGKLIDVRREFDFVIHRHRVHKPRDGVPVNNGGLVRLVDQNDAPRKRITLQARPPCLPHAKEKAVHSKITGKTNLTKVACLIWISRTMLVGGGRPRPPTLTNR